MRFTNAGSSRVRSTLIFGHWRRRCPYFGEAAAEGGPWLRIRSLWSVLVVCTLWQFFSRIEYIRLKNVPAQAFGAWRS